MRRFYGPIGAGATVFFLGIFVSGFLGLYDRMPQIDKLFHVGGGFVAAWLAWTWLTDDLVTMSPLRRGAVIVAMACLIGIIWEFAEFGASYLRTTAPLIYEYFRGGGLADSLGDIVADIIGALAFVASISRNRA